MVKNLVKNILALALLGGIIFAFYPQIQTSLKQLRYKYLPCREPIYYEISKFDESFGLTKEEFLKDIKEAETIWEKPSGKNLFEYKEGGDLKINLVYDDRQKATVKLQNLDAKLDTNKANYDKLKAQYDALQSEYNRDKASFESSANALQVRQSAYEKEVQYWNSRGGAKKEEYTKLEAERTAINKEVERLNSLQVVLNQKVSDLNALAKELNRFASALNLDVKTYNQIGEAYSEEFEEGLYKSSIEGTSIEIYQYENKTKLIRVLAHELGHALGLEHVEDSKSIMYELNLATNKTATADDLAELDRVCNSSKF